ncbi:MAG: hypothetical protein ACOYO1_07035 [Bacteroidales bacterium]
MQRIDSTKVFYFPILEIKNKNICPIFDSIIKLCDKCIFDRHSLNAYFFMEIFMKDNDRMIFLSANESTVTLKDHISLSSNLPPFIQGVFYYRDELFTVNCDKRLQIVFDSLFSITNKITGIMIDEKRILNFDNKGFIKSMSNELIYKYYPNGFELVERKECDE